MKRKRPTVEQTFTILEVAAINGARCPTGDVLDRSNISALAKAGRISIEISGRNWRQVTILEGPHKGKRTAPNPKGHRVYLTIDKAGALVNGERVDLSARTKSFIDRSAPRAEFIR